MFYICLIKPCLNIWMVLLLIILTFSSCIKIYPLFTLDMFTERLVSEIYEGYLETLTLSKDDFYFIGTI